MKILIILTIAIWAWGCTQKAEIMMTVNGPVNSNEAGITLPHEHFLVDFIGADSTGYSRWNKDSVILMVLPYLRQAKAAGVNTIMDCTPAYLGRDPVLLQRLSDSSGLNIITNTGYYGAIDNKALPPHAFTMNADQLAGLWVAEWTNGIESTGIKPGFIKIAVPGDSVLSPVHEKIVRAAAKAHLKTGLVINAHTGPDAPAFSELQIIKEEGVSPSALIWTHAQSGKPESHIKMAKEGCWISLDNVMPDNIDIYIQLLENLKNNNLLNRVLISHDAGWYDVINPESVSYRGHTAIFTHLKPELLKKGFTSEDWHQITVTNPAEAYAVRVRTL